MKKCIYIIMLAIVLSIALAVETNTTSYTINYIFSSIEENNNTANYNITSGSGQLIIDNRSLTTVDPLFGIFYITNETGVDSTNPVVTITSPTATTYTTGTISIDFSATDNIAVDDLFYDDGTTNTSYTTATTITLPNGDYSYTFYANDTAGNLNSTVINFTVNIAAEEEGLGGGAGIDVVQEENVTTNVTLAEEPSEEEERLLGLLINIVLIVVVIVSALMIVFIAIAIDKRKDKNKPKDLNNT